MHVQNALNEDTADPVQSRFDDDGFLLNPDSWNAQLAVRLAREAGIETLTKTHWLVIHYLRSYYQRLQFMPPARTVCRQLGVAGHDIKTMFGGCLVVWKISGLPNPGEEAKTYIQ